MSRASPVTGCGIPLRRFKKIQSAFTLIEIIFVVIIIGILTGISLPNFRKTFDNLQLNSSARNLQAFMNSLHERAIIEGEIIYLNIDDENKKYWAYMGDGENRLKTYQVPDGIKIEPGQEQIMFYPDGSIDEVTLRLINRNNQYVSLTTKGVFGGVKLQSQE